MSFMLFFPGCFNALLIMSGIFHMKYGFLWARGLMDFDWVFRTTTTYEPFVVFWQSSNHRSQSAFMSGPLKGMLWDHVCLLNRTGQSIQHFKHCIQKYIFLKRKLTVIAYTYQDILTMTDGTNVTYHRCGMNLLVKHVTVTKILCHCQSKKQKPVSYISIWHCY